MLCLFSVNELQFFSFETIWKVIKNELNSNRNSNKVSVHKGTEFCDRTMEKNFKKWYWNI